VGKNKLARWAEMKSFNNVIEPETEKAKAGDYPLKGRWRNDHFKNNNPIVLELGCGKGEYTVGLAVKFPLKNIIGIDIKGARIWRGAKTAIDDKIPNASFLRTRIEFINSFFSNDEVDELWLTFPDPHPKKRNARKRLTSPHFLNLYRSFLKDNGIIHLKTDNSNLFNYTHGIIKHNHLEIITSTEDLHGSNFENDILSIRTHYENLFLRKGIRINYLSFRLDKNSKIEDAG
jgi:tRNA (guanine-N7-)-methyltransferase